MTDEGLSSVCLKWRRETVSVPFGTLRDEGGRTEQATFDQYTPFWPRWRPETFGPGCMDELFFVTWVATRPDRRRRGLATALMTGVMERVDRKNPGFPIGLTAVLEAIVSHDRLGWESHFR